MINETHKDRNAARRRRGWGKKVNTDGAVINEWSDRCVRYTLITVVDINGFISCAYHTIIQDEISDEGEAGTVNSDYLYIGLQTIYIQYLGALSWEKLGRWY